MNIRRYMIGITFLIIFIPLIILVIFFGRGSGQGATSEGIMAYSLFQDAGLDGAFIIMLTVLTGIIGGICGGYLFGSLFIIAHKRTLGRKMIYGIQEKSKSEVFKKAYIKALFPALMTLNLCLIFGSNQTIQRLVTHPNLHGEQTIIIFVIVLLMPLLGGISMGLFSPVWFLEDGGIVYSNKEKVKNSPVPTEVKSLGGWYMNLLKGYAGISVIINFYSFLSEIIGVVEFEITHFLFFIIWPLLPLFIAFLLIPGIIALDITFEKRRAFILKKAGKYGIVDKVEEPTFK